MAGRKYADVQDIVSDFKIEQARAHEGALLDRDDDDGSADDEGGSGGGGAAAAGGGEGRVPFAVNQHDGCEPLC